VFTARFQDFKIYEAGIDEQRIREYVQWQENKEREIEKLQGNLFGEEEV
jgi:hypothetical protein